MQATKWQRSRTIRVTRFSPAFCTSSTEAAGWSDEKEETSESRRREDKKEGVSTGKEGEEEKKKRQTRHRNSRSLCDLFSTTLLSSPLLSSLSLLSLPPFRCVSQNRRRGSFLLCFRLCAAHTGLQTSLSRLTPCDSCAPFTPCSPSNALSLSPSLSLEKGRKKEERREKERKSPRWKHLIKASSLARWWNRERTGLPGARERRLDGRIYWWRGGSVFEESRIRNEITKEDRRERRRLARACVSPLSVGRESSHHRIEGGGRGWRETAKHCLSPQRVQAGRHLLN